MCNVISNLNDRIGKLLMLSKTTHMNFSPLSKKQQYVTHVKVLSGQNKMNDICYIILIVS